MGEQVVAQRVRFSWLSLQPGRCGIQQAVATDATSAIRDARDMKRLSSSAPFPFAFLFAFSVPR